MKDRGKYAASEAAIQEFLRYDPVSGKIFWKKKPPHSRVMVGDEAGCRNEAGHIVIKLYGRVLWAHCVAWWIATGSWPAHEVDHRDGVRNDNRIENLREATRTQNAQNRRASSKTGKGLKGAYTHHSMNGRWFGQIVVDGKQIYLGRFDTEDQAHIAYAEAANKFHGEFAKTT